MAYQHFYTRVPSRLSMFEHTDGFDTFIKSSYLDNKMIIDNLYPFCVIKLTQNESNTIRDGKYPVTFSQYISKKGLFVQNALTYLPLDFTGERSCYLVHSLVFTEEERLNLVKQTKNVLLNQNMFSTDIETFELNNKENRPIEDYEEKKITFARVKSIEFLKTEYLENIFKKFLYAVIQSTLTKGKNVYVTFKESNIDVSQKALDLMNAISAILPAVIKNKLSFITFLPEKDRYNNLIRIKFIPSESFLPIQGKGYFFDFTSETPSFIKENDFKAFEHEIDFFYDLISNVNLRDSFLKFYNNICEENSKAFQFDLNDLKEIILLFKASNEFYSKDEIIPFEKEVFDLLTIYEYYRNYLSINDRLAILDVFQRYPERRIVIPQTTFQKISKVYQSEPEKCKKKIMAIILELIHTDVMRDKLFMFIKANYTKESRQDRDIISEDLSRVFYGGFLQPQILNLFSAHFESESIKTREIILEKLLLSIRTMAIQERIIAFLDALYDKFNNHEKEMIYNTFYEMIPYVDNLSKTIIYFIDEHLQNESSDFVNNVFTNIASLVSNDEHKKEKLLARMIIDNNKILAKNLIHLMFTSWNNRNIYDRYIDLQRRVSLERLCDIIILVISMSTDYENEVLDNYLNSLVEIINNKNSIGNDNYNYFVFDIKLRKSLLSKTFQRNNKLLSKEKQKRTENFYYQLYERALKQKLSDYLLYCIESVNEIAKLDEIISYQEINENINEDKGFSSLLILRTIITLFEENNLQSLLEYKVTIDDEAILDRYDNFINRVYKKRLEEIYSTTNDQSIIMCEYIMIIFKKNINIYTTLYENIIKHTKEYSSYAFREFKKTKESKNVTIDVFASIFAFEKIIAVCDYMNPSFEDLDNLIDISVAKTDKMVSKMFLTCFTNYQEAKNIQAIEYLKNKTTSVIKDKNKSIFSFLFKK